MNIVEIERTRVLAAAEQSMSVLPMGITSCACPRSPGDAHDYYSEADYWWPLEENPDAAYERRDGMTNPDAFTGHRNLLVRLSLHVPTLVAAYKITRDENFARHAIKHLRTWFLDESTRMTPDLQYAQAIKGRCTGRGIGIVDTIHLIEVAKAIEVLRDSSSLSMEDQQGLTQWFDDYLQWMMTHPYGILERNQENNHATCWWIQVAVFAQLIDDRQILKDCCQHFTEILLPQQMAEDGSFPKETARTKPYAYSIYNLDVMAGICQVLSTEKNNLWTFELPGKLPGGLPGGRGMKQGMKFLYPYLLDKTKWPLEPDVMHDEAWPVRQPCLLFAGLALNEPAYLDLWQTLNPDPTDEEVVRNFPIRQPLLWLE